MDLAWKNFMLKNWVESLGKKIQNKHTLFSYLLPFEPPLKPASLGGGANANEDPNDFISTKKFILNFVVWSLTQRTRTWYKMLNIWDSSNLKHHLQITKLSLMSFNF